MVPEAERLAVRRHADWLRQARHQLETARWDAQGGFHDAACFAAQQAAELAAKAWLESQGRIEVGHSVLGLLRKGGSLPTEVEEAAAALDKLYIPTRYPNGFAEGAPMDYYDAESAREALAHAERILGFVAHHVDGV